MKMKSQKTNKRIWLGAAIGFALILLTSNPQPAFAQQWNTNGSNISNANSGNVGIGTTSPVFKLDIQGGQLHVAGGANTNVIIEGPATSHSLIQFKNAGTSRGWLGFVNLGSTGLGFFNAAGDINLLATDSGNVGIGTISPSSLLFVGSGSVANGALPGINVALGGASYVTASDGTRTVFLGADSSGYGMVGTLSNQDFVIRSNNIERVRVAAGGNVGIGTISPAAKLHVVSGTDNPNTLLSLDTGVHGGSQFQIGGTTNNESYFNLNVYRAGLYFNRLSVNSSGHLLLQPGGDSNVGIGTSGPNYKLDVQGGQINASGGFCIAGDCKTAWSQVGGGTSQWTTASSNIYYNTGNVGIGTTTPGYKLDVAGSINTTGVNVNGSPITSSQWTTTGTTINYSAGNVGVGTATPGYKLDVAGTVNATGVSINGSPISASQWTTNGTNINYASGNVGIGTATPTTKLHVVGDGKVTGNLTVDGNIAAKYQDVAEWVPASERISPGTVVVLDSTKSNQVISSAQAYDTRVAGVISERPGIALGERGDHKVLVATTGRVRIKVDATRGAIHIGDLLVTSDVSGMAMKSEPVNIGGVLIHRPGTLIGKALEPLAKGQGEILVLLSLQ